MRTLFNGAIGRINVIVEKTAAQLNSNIQPVNVCYLGMQDYQDIYAKMRAFTEHRTTSTVDELWVLQHPPVYTLGMNAKKEHLLSTAGIPVVQIDRGGEVTYHGPGQLVVYFMFDWRRRHLGIKDLVGHIEQSVINLLHLYDIRAVSRADARGVYVDGKKIAALGLRAKRKGCYHGLSLNVDMDLQPFSGINPCGYQGLETTQLTNLVRIDSIDAVTSLLVNCILTEFNQPARNAGSSDSDD